MKSIKNVAEIFNVSKRTVLRWIADGKINVIRIGGIVRISDEEIEKIKAGDGVERNRIK